MLVCVSDENGQELAGELLELGLISEVGVSCAKRRYTLASCVHF